MQKIEFGSTGLVIEKNGFGCLPIQRISEQDAVKLLHKAYDGGINFSRYYVGNLLCRQSTYQEAYV